MRLQDYLADQLIARVSGGASLSFAPVVGQNTFIGYMPSGITEGLLFAATLPLNNNHYSNTASGGTQVIFRCNDYDRADSVMREVTAIFDGYDFGSVITDGVRVLKMLSRHEPLTYPRIDTGGFEASVNFDVICTFQ